MKLCKELINELYETIRNGGTEKDAYTLANVNERTYFKWKAKGRELLESDEKWEKGKEPLEVQLIQLLKKAQSDFKLWHIQNIVNHAKRSWQASAWLLERKFPKEFNVNVEPEDIDKEKITTIKVEYVDSKQDAERLAEMEKQVKDEVLGKKANE